MYYVWLTGGNAGGEPPFLAIACKEAQAHRDGNTGAKWSRNPHDPNIDVEFDFGILRGGEIGMFLKLWISTSKMLFNTWDMIALERTGRIQRIAKLNYLTLF